MQLLLLWLFVAALRSNVDYNPFNFSVCPAEALDMKSCIKRLSPRTYSLRQTVFLQYQRGNQYMSRLASMLPSRGFL